MVLSNAEWWFVVDCGKVFVGLLVVLQLGRILKTMRASNERRL